MLFKSRNTSIEAKSGNFYLQFWVFFLLQHFGLYIKVVHFVSSHRRDLVLS